MIAVIVVIVPVAATAVVAVDVMIDVAAVIVAADSVLAVHVMAADTMKDLAVKVFALTDRLEEMMIAEAKALAKNVHALHIVQMTAHLLPQEVQNLALVLKLARREVKFLEVKDSHVANVRVLKVLEAKVLLELSVHAVNEQNDQLALMVHGMKVLGPKVQKLRASSVSIQKKISHAQWEQDLNLEVQQHVVKSQAKERKFLAL